MYTIIYKNMSYSQDTKEDIYGYMYFFGHKDCDRSIKENLYNTIKNLILNNNVDLFLVGNEGGFDYIVQKVLRELKAIFPNIKLKIILAYLPSSSEKLSISHHIDATEYIMMPDFENVPPRYAIDRRNNFMLKNADYVITYVNKPFGGAAKFYDMAIRKNKIVFNLANK